MTEDEIRLLSDITSGRETRLPASISEVPVISGLSSTQQKMRDILREREEMEELARQKEFAARPFAEKAKGAAEATQFVGSMVGRSMLEPFVELGGRAFGSEGEGRRFVESAKLPESELGLEYTARFGRAMEPVGKAMEATKLPAVPFLSELLPLYSMPSFITRATSQPGARYETRQEGPFYRVAPEGFGGQVRGNKEAPGAGAAAPAGSARGDVPQLFTDEQLDQVMAEPNNFVRSTALQYAQDVTGKPYELPDMAPSSLTKQAPIGRTFLLAATEDPKYKSAVFEAYGRAMPQVIEQSGAKNYDQLLEAAYRQLAKETDDQFKRLPVSMSFHRAGEGNYNDSRDMLRDIYGNKHLYVFQGGDPHPFLNKVDPVTGLNDNEKFRAVHDFFGHAIHGNQFGPKGEEIAWLAHSQMYSPLARLAMTAETRGQNSVVNYTPLNAKLKERIAQIDNNLFDARRRGQDDIVRDLEALKKDVFSEFKFAPQQGLLLPPEMLTPEYAGEVPGYIRGLIRPEPGTTRTEKLTHFSGEPNLRVTDPSRYGTGIRGEEAERLATAPDIRPRTFFYTGEEPRPEVGLGPYRYGAQADLYDISADPLQIRTLAKESLRRPMSAQVNPGMVDPGEALTAAERVLRDYGYTGYVVPESRAATVFSPLQVQRYANGGSVREIPTPEQFAIDEILRKQDEEEKARRAAEMSSRPILEKGKGALEAAQTTLSGIGRSMLMPFAELGGRMFGKEGEGERLMKSTPIPTSEMGQFYAQQVGDVMSEIGKAAQRAKIPDAPFLPELLPLSSAPFMAAPSAAKRASDVASTVKAELQTAPVGAIQLQTQPAPVNQIGLYSPAQQAALNLRQEKGTGNQFLAQISKTPGIKPAELEWTGLADFLKSRGDKPVTKQEINDFIRDNKVNVQEKELLSQEALTQRVNDILPPHIIANDDGSFVNTVSEEILELSDLPDEMRDDIERLTRRIGEPQYDTKDLKLPGGTNYREILLTLPPKKQTQTFTQFVENDTQYSMDDLYADPQLMNEARMSYENSMSNPARQGVFTKGHYDEPNVLAHMRVDDRTDAEGNSVLFVEELQSDWGQKGKKEGFANPKDVKYEVRLSMNGSRVNADGQAVFNTREEAQALADRAAGAPSFMAAQVIETKPSGLPPAPFVSTQQYQVMKDGKPLVTKNKENKDVQHIYDSPEDAQRAAQKFGGEVKDLGMQENTEGWVNLSLKRLITEAVNKGYDRVAFINGTQSADRYDLSKQVDKIAVPMVNPDSRSVRIETPNGFFRLMVNNDGVVGSGSSSQFVGRGLDEVVGKEMAEKIMNAEKPQAFTGVDLKVGGEGMIKFYDQIVPATANKLLKKLGGGKLEPMQIGDNQQLGFTITPEMRELVKKQGLPMFAKGGRVLSAIEEAGKAAKKASDAKRREQRVQANLEAYMGGKDKPKTYYHATQAKEDFEVFDLEKRPTPKSSKAVFLTPSKDWASDWLSADMDVLEKTSIPKPRVMPMITRAKNTFDYENPEHVEAVMKTAKFPKKSNPFGPTPAPPSLDHIQEQISLGNWNFIEDRSIQQAIRDLGFDSFNVNEKGTKNLGVFDIRDVKSLFNRGSYDPNEPSISKAKGGLACL